jgi:hypothetical protein
VRSKTLRTIAIIGLIAAIPTFGLAAPAAAHEERTVAGYAWAVGFGDEPTYAGFPNSVQLLLSKGGKPVTKLPGSLKVAVEFGDATKDLELEPNFEVGEFGTPGDYRAFFIPTRPGKYTFHFTGQLGGTSVDESFTSGPTTFSEVDNPTSQEFPVQDPTAGELAQRIDREVPRLSGEIQSAANTAEDKANTATTIAIVGLIIGLLGIAAGGIAMSRTRRT